MNKRLTNQALQFLLALALPLVAIGAGLQSCSDDGPAIPSTDNVEKEGQVKNLLMRSPEEAIGIAQRAWEEFYGGESSASSRSGRRCVIDYGRPVEVVRGAKSRGGSGSDTLLYVVNFANDGGFAVIAAPRHADELLAVTSQGHYYPESQPDQEKVPGFELWMENAKAYSSIVFDSTKIVKPIDPDYPGRLQQKEWEDTLQNIASGPYIDELWGQGCGLPVNLNFYPEGYLFENGWAGCCTAAIAMVCAHYSAPTQVNETPLIGAASYQLDWSMMKRHRTRAYGGPYALCKDNIAVHNMIAKFYKIITVWTDATPHGETGTSTKTTNVLPVLRKFLPEKTIYGWTKLNFEVGPGTQELFLMEGKSTSSGHMWLCDGYKNQIIVHYFATRTSSNAEWEIQTQERRIQQFLHYNWGWNGRYDGWYNNATSTGIHKYNGEFSYYTELKYARIR